MKKNMKGFTLIELLAVIVILAVIALIATPIIMGVINDSKKGADRDGAYGVVKAIETAMAQEMIDNPAYAIPANCAITINATTKDVTCGTLKVDFKGTKPSGGTVLFDATKGSVKVGTTVKMPSGTFTLDADGKFGEPA